MHFVFSISTGIIIPYHYQESTEQFPRKSLLTLLDFRQGGGGGSFCATNPNDI
jgi:hypothetical protein